ncbi:MAG: TetR/AcrR family transcriptional regulator [Syntrophobacteraceae bacterium]
MNGTVINENTSFASIEPRSMAPGYIKIVGALKLLLKEKEFNAITWAEIARTAGVNEALIYKYFHDKRNLLYQVLRQLLEKYIAEVQEDLKVTSGALNKLRKAIRVHFNAYSQDRIFAKILILEVRNYPDYFESETYGLVKHWANSILEIIEEGVRNGEIRSHISPRHLRQIILGGIEHLCLPEIVSGREFSPDTLTKELCEFIFHGITRSAEEKTEGGAGRE